MLKLAQSKQVVGGLQSLVYSDDKSPTGFVRWLGLQSLTGLRPLRLFWPTEIVRPGGIGTCRAANLDQLSYLVFGKAAAQKAFHHQAQLRARLVVCGQVFLAVLLPSGLSAPRTQSASLRT
jgi:hypothetical protein